MRKPGPTQTKLCNLILKMARGLKFWIYEEEGLYYLCSENKGAKQLCVSVFAYAKILFSHVPAQLIDFKGYLVSFFFGFCEFYEYLKFQRHSVSPLTFWGRFNYRNWPVHCCCWFVCFFCCGGGGGMPS